MGKKSDNNLGTSLQLTTKMVSNIIRHRDDIKIPFTNKVFKNKGKIPAIVKDVIENIWNRDGNNDLKPLIVEKKLKDNKHTFIIHLPMGIISYDDFKSKENYFNDAINGDVQIDRRGISVILTALEGKLEKNYKYEFDPSKYPKMYLPFPIGISVTGLIVRDLAKFPYLLNGGLPDFGKSNLIHVINTALLIGRPNDCFIVTFDFKKSEYTNYMEDYGLLITDEPNALIVCKKLEEELERRMDLCVKYKKQKTHSLPKSVRPPFIIIEVDEITELQNKECQLSINRIMRLGRAYGFCVAIATQKPSARTFRNETFTETRSLCSARMCYYVVESQDSVMILNNAKGVDLPAISGRGIFKHGKDEITVQTMYVNPEKIPEMIRSTRGRFAYRHVGEEDISKEVSCYREEPCNLKQEFQRAKKSRKMLPPR